MRRLNQPPLLAQKLAQRPVLINWSQYMLESYESIHGTLGSTDRAELLARLQPGTYLYTTFGPDGQNKTVCDFLYLLKISASTTGGTIAKTGTTLRWDFDGTVYPQNNLPAHTKGSGSGVVTVSSTDGWSGVTSWRLNQNNFTGLCPKFNLPGTGLFQLYTNTFSGPLPAFNIPGCTSFQIYGNQFSGTVPVINMPNAAVWRIYNNSFTGYESQTIPTVCTVFNASGCAFNQASIDTMLSNYITSLNSRPTTGITISLNGGTNSAPSSAGNINKATLQAYGVTVTTN